MDKNLESELRRIGVASELDADYDAANRRISEARRKRQDPYMPLSQVVTRMEGKYLMLLKMEEEGRMQEAEYSTVAASLEADIGAHDKAVVQSGQRSSRRMTAVVEGIKKRFVEPSKREGTHPSNP